MLLRIIEIREWYCHGSVGVSDEWRAYAGIPNLLGNYQHTTVNHSEYSVNPVWESI